MRDLFLSEQRYVGNIVLRHLGHECPRVGPVLSEYYAPPRRSLHDCHFNTDFVLRFVERGAMQDHQSFCARVMPNTMGAEVFVTVDTGTSQVLMTELDSGEAFSVDDFKPYVDLVESELAGLGFLIGFKSSRYCRVLVVENDICFLVFPDEPEPVMRGAKKVLRKEAKSEIVSYTDDHLVCVDGWIHTTTPDSEWILAAEADEH